MPAPLADFQLPGKSLAVKELYPAIHILGLSTFNQQSFIEKMINNGASGYVIKNATGQELMEAIHTVVKGKQFLSFDAAMAMRKPDNQNNMPLITRREKEVLELIADGMTNNVIAQKLFISSTTVDTHRKNLLAKFEVKNTASLIRIAAQMKII